MKKKSILFTNLALASLLVPNGTFAWFTDKTGPIVNEFKAGTLLMSINDNFDVYDKYRINPGDSIEKSVVICNDSRKKVFVRVIIDAKFEKDLKTEGVVSYKLGEGWIKKGKYYYFNKSLAADCSTPALFTKIFFNKDNMSDDYQGKRFSLIIISESIEADREVVERFWGKEIPELSLLSKGDYGPCPPLSELGESL